MKHFYKLFFLFSFLAFSSDILAGGAGGGGSTDCVLGAATNKGTIAGGDNCFNATPLGNLATPCPCDGATVAPFSWSTTNIGATAENPYVALTDCGGGTADQANPAADVWYTVNISGNDLNLNISGGIANPNVAIYAGTCTGLVPRGCAIGSGGALTTTFENVAPGETIYIQISGANTTQTGNFTLTLSNLNSCKDCIKSDNLTVNPAPINGTYQAGQSVTFCYSVTSYNQENTNWIHGIVPVFGSSWDLTTLTTTPAASCDGGGQWKWFTNISTPDGNKSGFFYDRKSITGAYDNNPTNNFGDNCSGTSTPWKWCWTIKTKTACTEGGDLGIDVLNYADGETGSWTDVACDLDPTYSFSAVLTCCPLPVASSTKACPGQANGTGTVTGMGASPWDYVWKNSAGTTISTVNNLAGAHTVNNLAAGTYTVTVTDNNNCVKIIDVIVLPEAAMTLSTAITNMTCGASCNGAVNLTVSGGAGGYSYVWSNTATTQDISAVCAGAYTVTVMDASTCTATISATVGSPPIPSITASASPSALCSGTSTTISSNASGGTTPLTYSWSSGQTTSSFTVSPTTTTTYTVTVRDANLCTATSSVIVTVNPLPSVSLTAVPINLCSGDSSKIKATVTGGTPAFTYSWSSSPSGFTSTKDSVYVKPTVSTAYTITVTDSKTCTATASVTINPVAPIVVNPTASPLSICPGESSTVSAAPTGGNGFFSYSWTSNPSGFTSSGSSATVSPTITTTYIVNITSGGCTKKDSVTVTVKPVPTSTFTVTTPVCIGANSTVTYTGSAPAGATYSWNFAGGTVASGAGQGPYTVNWPSAGTKNITLTVTQAGCVSTVTTVPVIVNPTPTSTFTATTPVCIGANSTITYTGSAPAGATYSWNFAGGTVASGAGQGPYTVNWPSSGTKNITLTVTQAGCVSTVTTVPVVVNPIPTSTFTVTTPVCIGANSTITYTGSAPAGATYTWDFAGGTVASGAGQGPYTVNWPSAGTKNITLTVTQAGCVSTVTTVPVVVNPTPTSTFTVTTPVCIGANSTITYTGSAPAGATYTWNFAGGTVASGAGQGPYTVNWPSSGTKNITLTVTQAGCVSTVTTVPVVVNPTPIVTATPATQTICSGGTTGIALTSNVAGTTFAWTVTQTAGITGASAGSGTPIAQTLTNSGSTAGTATYTITPTANGCVGAPINVVITVNPVPTAAISGTTSICEGTCTDLTFTLTGNGPFDVVYTNGTSNFNLTDINTGHTVNVCPGSNTTYSLVSVTDNSTPTCTGTISGAATITTLGAPIASNITATCNGTQTAYTVEFTISGGDNTSYIVTPAGSGTLTGNVFTSNLISSGTGYSFTVNDANNCDPFVVSGTKTCACITDAGTMNTTPLNVCEDQEALATHNNDHVFDANDVMMFVLHTGNGTVLGTVLDTNTTPSFNFSSPPLSYGTTYYISAVVGDDNGSGLVNLSDPCLSVAQGTPVVFIKLPTAIISGNATVCNGSCTNLTFTLTGNAPFDVVYTDGTSNFTLNDINTGHTQSVCPTGTTTYSLVSVADNSTPTCAGSVSGSALVTVNPLPTAAISGNSTICDGACTDLTFTLTGNGPFDVVYTDGTTPVTLNNIVTGHTVNVCPTANTTYTLVSVTDNSTPTCTGTVSGSAVIDITPLPTAEISGNATICNGACTDLTFTLTGNGPFDVVYTDGTTPVTLNGIVTGHTVSVCPTANTTYSLVSVSDNSSPACVGTVTGSAVITITPLPTATLSGTAAICETTCTDLTFTLTGNGPFDVVYTDGTSNFNLAGIANGYTESVCPAATTTYSLVSVSDNSSPACVGTVSGTAVITINGSPTVSNIIETCNGTNTAYTVTFDIAAGDAGSYTVTGDAGTLTGSTFTSALITSGGAYTFTVDDANSCNPVIVTGDHTCNCATNAGTMDLTPIVVCEDQPAIATHNGNENFDGDDAMVFILHSGSGASLGTQYFESVTPSFSYAAPLVYGTTYYISAVAGNSDGAGSVDQSDPCLSVSVGTPVIFNPLPTVTISGTATICDGVPTNLSFTLTGNGPFDVVYNDGASNITLNDINTGHTITVTPASTTTYTLISVTDNSNPACNGTLGSPVTVTVNDRPTATVTGGGSLCADGTETTVSIALTGSAPWDITYEDGNGNSTPVVASASPYTFITSVAGTYIVTNITDATTCSGSSSGSAVIIVNPMPVVSVTPSSAQICAGFSTSLTASGAATYSWSPLTGLSGFSADSATVNASPADTTVYTVTGTTSNGCVHDTTVTVNVVSNPVISFTGDTVICEGEITAITATGADTYEWLPGGITDATVNVAPLSTQPYTVTGMLGSCTANGTVTVTVNPLPIPGINLSDLDAKICIGEAFTLTGTGAGTGTYTWSGTSADHGLLATSGSPVNATPTAPGIFTYQVLVEDANGCKDSTTTDVLVNSLPVPSITFSPSEICIGDVVGLTGNFGMNDYEWTGNGITTTNTANNPANTAEPTIDGTHNYTLSVRDANGCTASTNANLTVNPLPVVTVTPSDTTICAGKDATLTATVTVGTAPYSYSWDTSPIKTTQSITELPAGTTDYIVTVIDDKGCISSGTGKIRVNQLPDVIASADAVCKGDTAILKAFNAATYLWQTTVDNTTTDGDSAFIYNAASSQTYQVIGTDANGCTKAAAANLIVNALPVITATASPATICIDEFSELSGSPSANMNYGYYDLGFTQLPDKNVDPKVTTSYNIIGEDNNGCKDTAMVTVNVRDSLKVTVSPDVAICFGESTTLTAVATGGDGNYFPSWVPNNGVIDGNSLTVTTVNTLDTTTTLTVTINDGCDSPSADATVTVTVNPLPVVSIDGDDGCAPWTSTFINTSSPGTYEWDFDEDGEVDDNSPTPSFTFNEADNYTVTLTVTDANGCVNSGTTIVEVYRVPEAVITSNPGKTTMINPNFEFSSEGSTGNITEWIWDFDSLGASFEPNPSFSFPDTGTYVVTLIVSTPHCSATDTITVIVTGDFTIYIPNTFTPNEDGLNDFFYPQGDGISTETGDYEMMIFNRWGEMVYQTKDYTQPWKGSRNNSGDIMQVDTYVYKIIAKDKYTGKTYQFTGHVNLIK